MVQSVAYNKLLLVYCVSSLLDIQPYTHSPPWMLHAIQSCLLFVCLFKCALSNKILGSHQASMLMHMTSICPPVAALKRG